MTGGGGTSTNIVESPFFAATLGPYVFNAPYFDATDQEMRNNRQLTGSATSYWDKAGSHELKTGYEWFRSQRGGGGSQSSTSYVFASDFALDAGGPAAARRNGPPGAHLRARRVRRGLHPRDERRRAERRHELVLRAGPLGDQQPLVGGSRRALRTREGGIHRRHRRREQSSDRSPPGGRPRCARQWQAPDPRDIRRVFRAIQRAADRQEQSRGQRSGPVHRVPGTGGARPRLRPGVRSRQLPDHTRECLRRRSAAIQRVHGERPQVPASSRSSRRPTGQAAHADRPKRPTSFDGRAA